MSTLFATYRDVLRSYYGQAKERHEQRFLFYRYVYRPLSFPLSALAIRAGASADGVTLANFLILVGALLVLGWGGAMTAGAVLFFVYYVVDFVDGNVARYHGVSSYFGKLLDGMVDTVSILVIAAAAVGNVRSGQALLDGQTEIALGIAATVSALLRQNYRWRLAYLRAEISMNAASAEPETPSEQKPVLFVVWVFDNVATSLPLLLFAAALTHLVSVFVVLFFLLYGVAGNLETVISIVKNRSALSARGRDY